MKYILVTGGVLSGIGKGVFTSSVGALLKACGIKVTAIKIDPYINIDAGTFSPYEHGEVYVLDDGCEVDLDLGNYERFLDVNLTRKNNITLGQVFQFVTARERQGHYLGKTVQVVPHVTDAIKEMIQNTAKVVGTNETPAEVCIIELGGTIGDIEVQPFVLALRQLQMEVKRENFCCCHVSLVPCIGPSKEYKTKPTQHSVSVLGALGLLPDFIVCRSQGPEFLSDSIKHKISNLCGVEFENVLNLPDLATIYKVPLELELQGLTKILKDRLKLESTTPRSSLEKWSEISDIAVHAKQEIVIALVGKYTALTDSYTSVLKSIEHACFEIGAKPKILFIDSTELELEDDNQAWINLKSANGLLVPGGFGIRGVEGKIKAIKWARENRVPFLGICLGFQMAVVEYARNVMNLKSAHSAEFSADIKNIEPVVIEMLEYLDPDRKMGGTMRLGLRQTKFVVENSILRRYYDNKDIIGERHRHRYEINPDYIESLEKSGLRFVGRNEDGSRMEILELEDKVHPYFVAVQYHPEYLSRAFRPSPPYRGLVEHARAYDKNKTVTNGS